jgi:hypothetical protein
MSKKIAAVVGACGLQGDSIVDALLELGDYHVRGITRNPNSDAAKAARAKGVEIVQADADDLQSLEKAFDGATVVYGMSDFNVVFYMSGFDTVKAIEAESRQGINIAKAVNATPSVKHYVWSSVADIQKISGGKHFVPHFESKNIVDRFIRADPELHAKTTCLWNTYYTSNIKNYPTYMPYKIPTANQYVVFGAHSAECQFETMGPLKNTGSFFKAVIAQPEKTLGRIVKTTVEVITAAEWAQRWAKAQNTRAHFVRVPSETYAELFPGWGAEMDLMNQFWDEYKDKSWTQPGEQVLTLEDLGIPLSALESVDDYLRTLSVD